MKTLQATVPPFLLALALVPGCTGVGPNDQADTAGINGDSSDEDMEPEAEDPEQPSPSDLAAMFDRAGEEFDVPVDLLKSIALIETRWQMVQGSEEFEGQQLASGVMALRGEILTEGASLAGVSVEEATSDAFANIRAAAAWMSARADAESIGDRADLSSWGNVVADYSGIASEEGRASYVLDEVYPAMENGPVPTSIDLEFDLAARPDVQAAPGPDYADSIWRPSPNNSSRGSSSADMVIIHTCEGSYSGCWSWLQNGNSGVSAHYVINTTGSEISQLVAENRKAWHIGASYQCSNNSDVDCWRNGSSSNNFTVGIEHAGYGSQNSWHDGLIDASAQLVCDITQDQNIPRDKYHIVGHGQLQPYNRTDPGAAWPWTKYLARINNYCDDNVPEPEPDPDLEIVIDSNQSYNGSDADMEVSGAWTSSSAPSDWNTGYWWRSTKAESDPASFAFYLDAPQTLSVDAWWVEGNNRSAAAPFIIYNASDSVLGTVHANQQQNGGQWMNLGSYNFTAGWNHVDLSCWAPTGFVVVADAVRVRAN